MGAVGGAPQFKDEEAVRKTPLVLSLQEMRIRSMLGKGWPRLVTLSYGRRGHPPAKVTAIHHVEVGTCTRERRRGRARANGDPD